MNATEFARADRIHEVGHVGEFAAELVDQLKGVGAI